MALSPVFAAFGLIRVGLVVDKVTVVQVFPPSSLVASLSLAFHQRSLLIDSPISDRPVARGLQVGPP